MLAAGHLALGYLMGSGSAKLLNRSVHLPLLFLIAVLPDLDFLLPGIPHRGATHSLILQGIVAIPFLWVYRRRALPYLGALWVHSISDLFDVAGVQLFWPLSTYNHPILPYAIVTQTDPFLVPVEALLAGVAFLLIIRTRAYRRLMTYDRSTLGLLVPLGALGGSLGVLWYLARYARISAMVLLLPQLAFLVLFTLPLLQYGWRLITPSS
jgi:membrane-bound metal-dependent hydrolase YbcI (DUF457 family)